MFNQQNPFSFTLLNQQNGKGIDQVFLLEGLVVFARARSSDRPGSDGPKCPSLPLATSRDFYYLPLEQGSPVHVSDDQTWICNMMLM